MDSSETIYRYIDAYTPRLLSAQEWALAAGPVRRLVAAAGPRRVQQAAALSSRLCRFLKESSAWDRQTPPDLADLLSDRGITAFARAFTGASTSRTNYVCDLRTLARCARGLETPTVIRRAVPVHPVMARVATATQRHSIPTLAAVYRAHTGRRLSQNPLEVLIAQIVNPTATANAPAGVPGMMPTDHGARLLSLSAPDHELAMEAVPATKSPTPSPRPLSQRQQLALRRQERATAQALAKGPTLEPYPAVENLDPDVWRSIQQYRPQGLRSDIWAEMRPLTVHLVAAYQPVSKVSARNAATIIVRFLKWLRADPHRQTTGTVTAQELLSRDALRRYIALPTNHPAQYSAQDSRLTAHSVLRRAVGAIDASPSAPKSARRPIEPPYTPQECDELVAIAQSQNTRTNERNGSYLIGLGLGAGLGAGLGPNDLRFIRKLDIEEAHDAVHGPYLTVTVRSGRSPRTVPIRRAYEPLVRRALEIDSEEIPERLVLGRKVDRRGVTASARKISTARRGERISLDAYRLRTTWLFACMNTDMPLASLLQVAGLRSARTLTDLLLLCPAPNAADVAACLLSLDDATGATGAGGAL